MDVGSFLTKVGGAVLKNVPGGGLIYDIADAVLDAAVPNDVTGTQMTEMLKTLPPDQYSRIISKQLDAKIAIASSWSDLHKTMEVDSPQSRARAVIAKIFAVGIMILIILFTLMLGDRYLKTGELPDIEMVGVIMAVPALTLLSVFGIRSDKIIEFLLGAYVKRLK